MSDGVENDQQLSHARGQHQLLGLSGRQQPLVERADAWIEKPNWRS